MKAKWITPAVTAMDENGRVDIEANKKIYDFLIEKRHGRHPAAGQHRRVFRHPHGRKKGADPRGGSPTIDRRVPVYVGTNEMNLEACVELSQLCAGRGARTAQWSFRPTILTCRTAPSLNFYDTLADRVHGPVLLYNFPDRTGYDLRPDLVHTLVSRHKNIVGIKDTVPTMGPHPRADPEGEEGIPGLPRVLPALTNSFGHNVLSGGDGCIAGAVQLCAGGRRRVCGGRPRR